MTPTIYGIPNCDTVKKARAWLAEAGVDYTFHNYKTDGVPADRLAQWADVVGWERLLNRAGTTFRKLPDGDREAIDRDKALRLMRANPSLIKRPVLDYGADILVGFDAERYGEALR